MSQQSICERQGYKESGLQCVEMGCACLGVYACVFDCVCACVYLHVCVPVCVHVCVFCVQNVSYSLPSSVTKLGSNPLSRRLEILSTLARAMYSSSFFWFICDHTMWGRRGLIFRLIARSSISLIPSQPSHSSQSTIFKFQETWIYTWQRA